MSSLAPLPSGCSRVRARLEAFLDGGLRPLDEALDRGHLEACRECVQEERRARSVLALLRAAEARDCAEDAELVTACVLARVRELAPPRRDAPTRPVPIALLAAAAAVLALFLLGTRGVGLVSAFDARRLASVDRALDGLPSWSDLLRGLGSLSRHLS